MSELRPWRTLESELVFDHPWYRVRRDVVRLSNGRVLDDYLVSLRPEIALVCALTPARELVLVRQWKQGIRSFTLELPGGICEQGEQPQVTAQRELLEETGFACAGLRSLGVFEPDPSKDSHHVHVFLGLEAVRIREPRLEPEEEIAVELRPLAEARAALASGELTSLGTVAGIYRALDELGA